MRRKFIPLYVEASPGLAQPLTAEERAWAEKLNRVLQECPTARIGAYTISDANITLYDKELEMRPDILKVIEAANDFCVGVWRTGIGLGTVHSRFKINSTAG